MELRWLVEVDNLGRKSKPKLQYKEDRFFHWATVPVEEVRRFQPTAEEMEKNDE